MQPTLTRIGTCCAALTMMAFLGSAAMAAESWLPIDPEAPLSPEAPTVAVGWADDAGFEATVSPAGVALESRTTKGGEFVEVTWPEAAIAGDIGTPAVPVVRRLFIAPPGATVSATVQPGEAFLVELTDAGYPLPVMPLQAPVPKLPGALEQAAFDYDAAAYELDAEFPGERVLLEELGYVRGQRLFLLEVAPVAYNPVAGTLTYWPEIDVQVKFDGGAGWPAELSPLPGLADVVLNPDPLASASRAGGNYLIVVASAYESAIGTFAAAKEAQGFDVTTWVPTSATTTVIKNYIQGLYDGPNPPDYVLLVGDTNTIPYWTGGGEGSPATDLPYVCMDGTTDWYPDIAIGRFPVRSTSDVQDIVDKTLYYENGPLADPDYVMRAVFMASEDNYTVSEGTHNWVISNYMIPNDIAYDRLYCHTYSATTQQVRDKFNDGRFFGIYSGHGGTYSWADGPPFSQSDVNNLTNQNMYPFVCSFACITGTYTATECFTETWILAPDKGAIAIYGSSVNSYWTEDDVLEKRLFDAIYDEDDDVPAEVGPVWNDARMRYLAQMGSGSTTRRYFEMYNLMGDPSLRFPGAVDDPLYVSLPDGAPDALEPGLPTSFTVQIDNGSETYVPGSGTLHCRYDGGAYLAYDLVSLGGGQYEATLPPADCDDNPEFYISAEGNGGTTVYLPPNAPTTVYAPVVGTIIVTVDDDFETHQGWTVGDVGDDATTGIWERVDPEPTDAQPGDDHTPSPGIRCWVTDGEAGSSLGDYDVDGGKTTLKSPVMDLSDVSDATVSYYRWYSNDTGATPGTDVFVVDISNNGGSSWTNVETVGPSGAGTTGGWIYHEFQVADFVTPTAQVMMRFIASDEGDGSLVEAAVDDFLVTSFECVQPSDCLATGVSSCRDHAAAGRLCLDLGTASGIEPRIGGVTELEVTLDDAAGFGGGVTVTCLNAGDVSGYVSGTSVDGDTVTVSFSPALPDADACTVELDCGASVCVRGLEGDIDFSGTVTTSDASIIKPQFGLVPDTASAEFDVDASGLIATADFSQVKPKFGSTAPECP